MTAAPASDISSRSGTVVTVGRIGLWIVWAMILLGALSFSAVMSQVLAHPATETPAKLHDLRLVILIYFIFEALAIGLVHIARFLVLRLILRKRSWLGLAIAYPAFKVTTWAVYDAGVFFAFILCLLMHSSQPMLPVAGVFWLLIVLDPPLWRPFRKLEAGV